MGAELCLVPACRVAVLDGGLPAWKQQGYSVDMSPIDDNVANLSAATAAAAASHPPKTHYPATLDQQQV